MAVIHISEAEAARDFVALMARVRAGAEVVIDDDASAVAILRLVKDPHLRRLSESLKLAKMHGSSAKLDNEFGRDLRQVIDSHREPIKSEWD